MNDLGVYGRTRLQYIANKQSEKVWTSVGLVTRLKDDKLNKYGSNPGKVGRNFSSSKCPDRF